MPTIADFIADAVQQSIPMVVGVTGHRDLRPDDIPTLTAQVQAVFTELQRDYPTSPLLLLSPLAEGADRLVARVALACGARLVVPLPMVLAEFEQDFPTEASRAEFHELLARAEQCFVAPPGNQKAAAGAPTERSRLYANSSEYVARQSHVLIALWNGVDSDLLGGTAFTVRTRLHGLPEVEAHRLLDPLDVGPVYHIITPRASDPRTEGVPLTVHRLAPKGWHQPGRGSAVSPLAGIERLNQDLRRLGRHLPKKPWVRYSVLVPEEQLAALPGRLQALLRSFAAADMLALFFREQRRRTLLSLVLLGVLAAVLFDTYAHLLPTLVTLLAYPLTLGLGYVYYRITKRRDYENRYLDYRALAEGLRVQFFWQYAGLTSDVADCYLRKQQSELEWIRYAIRACQVSAGRAPAPAGGALESALPNVQAWWVEDQLKYFERAAGRDHGYGERLERYGHILFLAGLLPIIPVVVIHLSEAGEHWHHWLVTAMGILPAGALALDTFAEKAALSVQARQYHRMGALFRHAAALTSDLLAQGRVAETQAVLRELGHEALAENGDWVMLHRQRPLPLPKGV